MQILKKYKIMSALLLIMAITGFVLLIIQIQRTQDVEESIFTDDMKKTQYSNCVAGLLDDGDGGSNFVIYDADTWKSTVLMSLPDVTPDNYGAISSDSNYIAYTKWDEGYARRYLEVYSVPDGELFHFYQDIPVKNEIVNISWLPDNKTLLLMINDKNAMIYSEIRTLNIETGEENTLVKGEVWRMRTAEEIGSTAQEFYLKGQDYYIKVKYKRPVNSYKQDEPINPDIEWNYYLDQNDLNKIYHYYGGTGTFDIEDVLNIMYVQFSRPRCSDDGTKIIYSATLRRNSARGESVPLWMSSGIWEYDMETGQNSLIHSQTDGAAIGRVDWIGNDEICYITYYDFQGSRNSVNYINLSNNERRILFPYSDENYNNVTLLPVGNRRITFTSSKRYEVYENSYTILFDIDSNNYSKQDIRLEEEKVLLENFVFCKLLKEKIL